MTTGATVSSPKGVTIDPGAGRIYWANPGANKISFARLDGSGGGDLQTLAATVNLPDFPVLLRAPAGAGAPEISGGPSPGSTLSCSQGAWAPDLLGSFLYRAPQSFAYQWSRDGTDIPGATASTLVPDSGGQYRCRVTAQNHAGSSPQTSEAHSVIENAFEIGNTTLDKKKGTATISVTLPGPGTLALSGQFVAGQSVSINAAGTGKLMVKAKGKARKKLKKKGKVNLSVTIHFAPTGGEATSQDKPVKLQKKKR